MDRSPFKILSGQQALFGKTRDSDNESDFSVEGSSEFKALIKYSFWPHCHYWKNHVSQIYVVLSIYYKQIKLIFVMKNIISALSKFYIDERARLMAGVIYPHTAWWQKNVQATL
jgi:hypothetical protein